MSEPDYYALLGVPRDADAATLKKAFRAKAIELHPDRNSAPDAEERFKAVNEAYAVLSDPDKRAHYDRFGTAPSGVGGNPFQGRSAADFRDIFGGDLFEQLFGNLFGGRARHGRDIRVNLTLTLREVAYGGEQSVTFRRRTECEPCGGSGAKPGTKAQRCDTCGGAGRVRVNRGIIAMVQACPQCAGRGQRVTDPCAGCSGSGQAQAEVTVKLNVPAGIQEGHKMRVDGAGHPGDGGGMAGDLYIVIKVGDDPFFDRDDDDLLCEVPITFPQAALGAQIEVPTLDGKAKVKVPAGTQSGKRLRLRGKGLPKLRGGHGDLYVRLQIETPKSLSARQRELLEAFEQESGAPPRQKGFLDKLKDWF